MNKNFWDWADKSGLHLLRSCYQNTGKIAVITTKERITKFKTTFNIYRATKDKEEQKFKMPLSFGKESLLGKLGGFSMRGWIPSSVLMRMSALYTAGLIEYHNKYDERYYEHRGMLEDIVEINEFRATNLHGNIRVIFVVLPVGILPALGCFICEYLLLKIKWSLGKLKILEIRNIIISLTLKYIFFWRIK